MKRGLAGLALLLIAAAYIAGYWPERQRRVALDDSVASLRAQLDEAEARLRAARLLGELLNVTDAVAARNFGQAQTLSSRFFDDVGNEATRTPLQDIRSALETILRDRDAVTRALALGEADVMQTLRSMQVRLREALGYALSVSAPPVESAATRPPP